jgi:hypothetical protein
MMFKRNIGFIDRILRTGIGLGMMYVGFLGQHLVADYVTRMVIGGMGVFMIVIAIIGICPMYALIGFSTHSQKPASAG